MCYCGSEKEFNVCCEPFLTGEANPPTAEACMRSRYSAFVTHNIDYIHNTLDPTRKHEFDSENIKEWATKSTWEGLQIAATEKGGVDDTEGTVEFIARFSIEGVSRTHHEVGVFRKENGIWYFVNGEIITPKPFIRKLPKTNRNDPCTCGSGKKFKKCCGKSA